MKRLAYIFLAVSAMAALFSCKDEEGYMPGPQAEGSQYYFSQNTPTSVSINQSTTQVTLDVYRVETSSASTVTIGVSDESGLISPGTTATASFNAGSNKATITFPIDPTKFEFAKNYPVTYTISTETTPYGYSTYTVKYQYPTPLKSLGKGKYVESFFWGLEGAVEILQSELDPYEFHVRGMIKGKDDFVFVICQPGNSYNNVPVTKNDLIYYKDWFTGVHNADYDDDMYLLHASRFSAGKTEDAWEFNKVLAYQENGLPGSVSIGCAYYMFNVGGWNKSQQTDILLTFPGYEPKDYALEVEYTGFFTDVDGAVSAEANVVLGADVENGVAVLVPGDGDEAIAAGEALLEAGDESVVEFTGATVRVPLPEEAQTGKYTIVVGAVAEGAVQAIEAADFYYQAGEVALDWDWLVGTWKAQDLEGDPYEMTVTKKDETTAIFAGIWGMGPDGVMEGTVDFEAKTVTFKGPFDLGEFYGGHLFICHYDAENDVYDDGEFVATLAPSGITISGQGYYVVGGNYEGQYGGDVTKMTK